jgi:hypothetical protein
MEIETHDNIPAGFPKRVLSNPMEMNYRVPFVAPAWLPLGYNDPKSHNLSKIKFTH